MKDGWDIKKLGEVCFITMGQSPNSESYNKLGDGLPFFQGCSDFGAIHPLVTTWCNQPNKIANPNDILMSVRAPIGTLNIADSKCCIGRGLAAFTQKEGVTINKFLYYFLLSSKGDLQSKGTGATFKAIGKELIKNYAIKLPSLTEQQHIVEELDLLSSIIEKKKAQLNELDNLAQSLFYEMFGDPINNEKGWKLNEMEDLCLNIVDCPHSTPKKVDHITQYPCIRTSELKGGTVQWETMQYLDEDEYNKRIARLKPIEGDIVFGREGTIGDAVILPKGYFFSLGQRTMLLRVDNSKVSNVYLHRVILSEWVKRQIESVNVSSTVAHVNIKDFKLFRIPVPPFELQTRFEEKIEAIEHQKELIEKSIKEVETLFNSRMDYHFN